MGMDANVTNQDGVQCKAKLATLPDKCPLCGKFVQPNFIHAVVANYQLHAVFRCPVTECRGMFIGVYKAPYQNGTYVASLTTTTLARVLEKKVFQKNVEAVSPMFCAIYNQSLAAEQNSLDQICGPGYRKALEFLVKDFLINHQHKGDEAKRAEIEKGFLGPVIKNFLDENRIKECAKRAAWLGNDETHYVRKWTNKDIQDLKSLVEITASWIDSVIEADRYLGEMPE